MNVKKLWCVLGFSSLLLAGLLTGQANAGIVPGDFDNDCDVDATDFQHFRTCALGAAVAQTNPLCADAHLDADTDVDLDDFGVFQRCYSGAGHPADPNCNHTCAGTDCNCLCGQTSCNGICTCTASDTANCGACGHVCGSGLTCVNGSCAGCAAGYTLCDGVCTYLGFDTANCGACGNVCPPGFFCAAGVCEGTGQAARVNPNHHTCPGANCNCVCGQTDCGGTCTVTASDEANCGTCGHACAVGTTCLNGSCIPVTCGVPLTLCGSTCVDVSYDNGNCGSCGHHCQTDETCVGSLCEPSQ